MDGGTAARFINGAVLYVALDFGGSPTWLLDNWVFWGPALQSRCHFLMNEMGRRERSTDPLRPAGFCKPVEKIVREGCLERYRCTPYESLAESQIPVDGADQSKDSFAGCYFGASLTLLNHRSLPGLRVCAQALCVWRLRREAWALA